MANNAPGPAGLAAEPIPTPPTRLRPYAELFLISFEILFLELACIRWFGSTVIFLTFFTNLVLMASFLGMSVGCLAARRRADLINTVLPLMIFTLALSYATLWAYHAFGQVVVDVGGQKSPQEVFFGTESRPADPSRLVIPIEAVAGVFFALIALAFCGLGQVMGRRFNAVPNRVLAYSTNILGSLAGIGAFGLLSYAQLSPLAWFGAAGLPCVYFVTRHRPLQVAAFAAALATAAGLQFSSKAHDDTTWSPYYKVDYDRSTRFIYVNNIMHQGMLRYQASGLAYALPYLMNRDSGGRTFDDVLVIGAGSGNDVAAALANGARHVDAVEIDPRIYELGRRYHPDRPYANPRVSVHLDDGRRFLRKTDRKYDLVVFALLDSLVLHSGYSSLRLESFLFTEQSFRDIKARLKPGGVFAMYNFYRQGWVVGRLERMAESVFGGEPLVFSFPYKESITPGDSQGNHITFLLAEEPPTRVLDAVRESFRTNKLFWGHNQPAYNGPRNGFGPAPPVTGDTRPQDWQKFGPVRVETRADDVVPTDDWPFLYLRAPVIPALNLRGMALVAVISLLILAAFAPRGMGRPNGQMFFLGAGFMLLETKGVVHLALLFGSTWVVNSVVFAAILVMILLSNLFLLAVRPKRVWPSYLLLTAALLVNAGVPMQTFLALPATSRVAVSCVVVFLPIFFAGLVFGVAFRDSARPDIDFGWNIAGAIFGGLAENASLVVGFNHLLFVAIGFYALSALLRPRAGSPQGAPAPAGLTPGSP
jgi:spermidine synthase